MTMIQYNCEVTDKKLKDKWVPAKYLQRFLSLNSAADMLEKRLFPTSNTLKEVAESMSMFYAVSEKIMSWDTSIDRNMDNINIVVIGDGHTPRTAALFAYMTKWKCFSVDPEFRKEEYNIKRLTLSKSKIEDVSYDFGDEVTIIILPHSHAPVQKCWDNIKSNKKWLIKMECCTRDKLNIPAYFYKDKYAITPANEIYIWSNYIKF